MKMHVLSSKNLLIYKLYRNFIRIYILIEFFRILKKNIFERPCTPCAGDAIKIKAI